MFPSNATQVQSCALPFEWRFTRNQNVGVLAQFWKNCLLCRTTTNDYYFTSQALIFAQDHLLHCISSTVSSCYTSFR